MESDRKYHQHEAAEGQDNSEGGARVFGSVGLARGVNLIITVPYSHCGWIILIGGIG